MVKVFGVCVGVCAAGGCGGVGLALNLLFGFFVSKLFFGLC